MINKVKIIKKTGRIAILIIMIMLFAKHLEAANKFFKAGVIVFPSMTLAERWRIAAGADFDKSLNFKIGFEIQTAYQQEKDVFYGTWYNIPLNLFINIKYMSKGRTNKLFLGAGTGLVSQINNDGWHKFFGLHLVGGIELITISQKHYLFELQFIMAGWEPELLIFAGIKW